MNVYAGNFQRPKYVVNDRRALGIINHREVIQPDDIHISLIKLAIATFLVPLATIDFSNMITTERERELRSVLRHIARQRHRQIKA